MFVLETERLTLRRLTNEDAAFVCELVNDASFLLNIGDKGVRNEDDAVGYIQSGPVASYERFGFGLYAVELKESRELIGICGLVKRDALPDADIGFAFLPRYWAKGYAVESAEGVRNYAKNVLGLNRILAITKPDNSKSIRVLEKIGSRFEGTTRIASDEPEVNLFAFDLRVPF